MPSHADRARRPDSDTNLQEGLTSPRDNPERPFSELERYAGWLGRDHVSIAVRAYVHALGAAMGLGTETSPLFAILNKDIGFVRVGEQAITHGRGMTRSRMIGAPGGARRSRRQRSVALDRGPPGGHNPASPES